jgi:hypothetical protein
MARDLIFIGVFILIIGLSLLTFHFVNTTITTKLIQSPVIKDNAQAVEALNDIQNKGTNQIDYLFLGVFIAFLIASIITSVLLPTETIFLIAYIIFWVLSVVFSSFFAYVWDSFSSLTIFNTSLVLLPITNQILSNLPIYLAIIGFLNIILLFGKIKSGGVYG